MGISEKQIRRFEKGIEEPNHSTLRRISHHFNISLQHLVELDLTIVDSFRDSKSLSNVNTFNYDHFLETTREAQQLLEDILTTSSFQSFLQDLPNEQRQEEISELIGVLDLLLQNNWRLIKMIKEYYLSLESS